MKRIIMILLSTILLASCTYNHSKIENESNDQINETIEEVSEETRVPLDDYIPLSDAERFELDYANGVYLKDYTEIKSKLNDEAKAYFSKYYEEREAPIIGVTTEVDLFHLYYDQVIEEELSFESILINHKEWIDEVKVYGFALSDYGDDYDKRKEFASKYYYSFLELKKYVIPHEQIRVIIQDVNTKFEDLIKRNNSSSASYLEVLQKLIDSDYEEYPFGMYFNTNITPSLLRDDYKELHIGKRDLEDTYKTKIQLVDYDPKLERYYYAPYDNLNLQFKNMAILEGI